MGSATVQQAQVERQVKKPPQRENVPSVGPPSPSSTGAELLPPEQHKVLLQRMQAPIFSSPRTAMLLALQRSHGNGYVEGLLRSAQSTSSAKEGTQSGPPQGGGHGQPLERPVRGEMERSFGASFSAIRVHTGADSAEAAKSLNATAFTAGNDIHFAAGAYAPGTNEGKRLLAHELAHTVQQGRTAQAGPSLYAIVPADHPLEREAEAAADAVVAGRRPVVASAMTPSSPGAIHLFRRDAAASSPPAKVVSGEPAKVTGEPAMAQPEAGGFSIPGILQVTSEELESAKSKARLDKDLSGLSLPGLRLKRMRLDLDKQSGQVVKGEIFGEFSIPYLKSSTPGDVRLTVGKDGAVSLKAKAKVAIAALNEPEIDLTMRKGEVSAETVITAEKLAYPAIPRLKVPQANVALRLVNGKFSGGGEIAVEYAGLASGNFALRLKDGVPEGKGNLEFLPPYLKGAQVALHVTEGHLGGEMKLPASRLAPPIPGLTVSKGKLTVAMEDGRLSGGGEGIVLSYRGLGNGNLDFTIAKDHLEGSGSLELAVPGLSQVRGELRLTAGKLAGAAAIKAENFPKGLPVKGGSIRVSVDESGAIAVAGTVGIHLFGVGDGEFSARYDKGDVDLTAALDINKLPGLQAGRLLIRLRDGKLEGEGEIGVAPEQIPGLTGAVSLIYKDERLSGKAKLGYAKEKLAGEVELVVAQDPKGKPVLSGSGEVTARLTDWLTGKVHLEVLPDAKTRIAGQLKADEIELFPEKKADRQLFSLSRNVPLWAIVVAVVRARGGIRAGVGPGKLRGVTAEGEFGTAPGTATPFSITGELFIPAYAEAYMALGAGLGLDVLVGSLTGGMEAVGTAGVYGAISVIPEITCRGGDYCIAGEATLAAGAKLKLGLQAWAELEALFVTLWKNEWKLAEWLWDVGPELALQARINGILGRAQAPEVEFKTSDIDPGRLLQDAMPKEGVKGSGTREALQNKAEWKGQLKKGRVKEPAKLPAELLEKQRTPAAPLALPPKPAKALAAAAAAAKEKDPAKAREEAVKAMEKATPADTKQQDKAHQERWEKGMAALDRLAEKAHKEPEDEPQIAEDLDKLKKEYGFKVLTYTFDAGSWLIDAAMSPGAKKRVDGRKPRHPEGATGTYGKLKGPSGDRLTPDHQPQNSLMHYVAKELMYEGEPLFKGTSLENYSRDEGICLNLHELRHRKTRSYGKNKSTAVAPILAVKRQLPKGDKEKAREMIGQAVYDEFWQDHLQLATIYTSPMAANLCQATLGDVERGANEIFTLNENKYFKAFKGK